MFSEHSYSSRNARAPKRHLESCDGVQDGLLHFGRAFDVELRDEVLRNGLQRVLRAPVEPVDRAARAKRRELENALPELLGHRRKAQSHVHVLEHARHVVLVEGSPWWPAAAGTSSTWSRGGLVLLVALKQVA